MKRENLERDKELVRAIEDWEERLFNLTDTKGCAGVKASRTVFKITKESGYGTEVGIDDLLPVESLVSLAVSQINKSLEGMRKELDSL